MNDQSKGSTNEEPARPATKDDIAALLVQLAYPANRAEIDDFPGVARALVRAARGFGLAVPPYLLAAGFRAARAPLRLIRGGKRDDGIKGIASKPPSAAASSTSDSSGPEK